MRPRRLGATGFLIMATLALTSIRNFHDRTAADIFFSITLASTAIVFLHMRPLWEGQLVVATGLLVLLQIAALKVPLRLTSALALLGIGSLALLAYRRIWSTKEERNRLHYAFLPPLLLVALGYAGSAPLEITGRLHPKALDLFLYNFDASMGVQLSSQAGQLVLRSRWLTRIALLSYFGLPIPVMLVYAQQPVRRGSAAMTVFLGFFLVGPVGVVFYNQLPACGPVYLLGSKFPFDLVSSQQIKQMLVQPFLISGVRNAFPSLHMAWALLAWWYADGLSHGTKFFLLLFLAGTVLATLGPGEHYFIDLVAALPFALMMQAGCVLQIPRLDRGRCVPFLAGLLLILGWVGLLRFGLSMMWVSPLIPWSLIACTIISCLVLQPWLEQPSLESLHPSFE